MNQIYHLSISDLTDYHLSASIDTYDQKLVRGGFGEQQNSTLESIIHSLQQSFSKFKDGSPNYSGNFQIDISTSGDGKSFAITSYSNVTSTTVFTTSSLEK